MKLVILFVICIGMIVYYKRALNRQVDKIDDFFLAGRNIGRQLFTVSTWGNSLGFGNSMFVAIWAGYKWGLSGIWVQGIWAAGMILYGYIIPHIIKFTGKYTLHGYLGSTYGRGVKNLTAFISLVGLIICIGFEITYFGEFFSAIMGNSNVTPIVVLVFATLIATFCSIGGYRGNVALDKVCNIFASIAMTIFLVALVSHHPEAFTAIKSKSSMSLAKDFIVPNMSLFEFIGFSVFTLFQIIDMTNWQTVSANKLPENDETTKEHVQSMKKAITTSALLFMIFPATVGTLIGYYFYHIAGADVAQPDVMLQAVTTSLSNDIILKTIMLAALLFGFLSSSLACTNSWLLASVQTISWDMIDFRTFKKVNFKVSELPSETHYKVVNRAKIIIYLVGAGGTAAIYCIYQAWDNIFALQFMMFGAGLAMLPAFIYSTIFRKTDTIESKFLQRTGLASIFSGFAAAAALFILSLTMKNGDLSGLIPPTALLVSFIILVSGIAINKKIKNA